MSHSSSSTYATSLRPELEPSHAARRGISRLLALLPAALMLACILAYGIDVPWHDEWAAIGSMFVKASLGTLRFADLAAQHNEHRIFFPRLVCLALGAFGRWDVRREMLATFCIVVATAWNLQALLARSFPDPSKRRILLPLLASLLLVSPAQWSNWFLGMQMALFVPPLCITTGWRVAGSGIPTWTRVPAIVLLCGISTFSVGNGILAWIVLLPAVLARRGAATPPGLRAVALWAGGLVACVLVYLRGYATPHGQPDPWAALGHPVESIAYFLAFLGAPFASTLGESGPIAGECFGAVQLVVFAACLLRLFRAGPDQRTRSLPWVSLGAYAILTAAMTTFAREGMSIASPVAPRYVSFAVWLGIATTALLFACFDASDRAKPAVFAAILAIGCLAPWPASLRAMNEMRATHLYGKACMEFAGVVEDLPGLQQLEKRSPRIRDDILAVDRGGFFRPRLVRSPIAQEIEGDPAPDCGTFLDLERRDGSLVASGRARLPWRNELPDAILLALDRPGEGSRIFAVLAARSSEEGAGARGEEPWSAILAAGTLASPGESLSAWAFDALTGRAYRLKGSPAPR